MIVSALYIYPVKSCRGNLVQEAEVTRLAFDTTANSWWSMWMESS
jgi:uncharacterized protein YcbX